MDTCRYGDVVPLGHVFFLYYIYIGFVHEVSRDSISQDGFRRLVSYVACMFAIKVRIQVIMDGLL